MRGRLLPLVALAPGALAWWEGTESVKLTGLAESRSFIATSTFGERKAVVLIGGVESADSTQSFTYSDKIDIWSGNKTRKGNWTTATIPLDQGPEEEKQSGRGGATGDSIGVLALAVGGTENIKPDATSQWTTVGAQSMITVNIEDLTVGTLRNPDPPHTQG